VLQLIGYPLVDVSRRLDLVVVREAIHLVDEDLEGNGGVHMVPMRGIGALGKPRATVLRERNASEVRVAVRCREVDSRE